MPDPRVTIRLDFSSGFRLGPGKVRLLEAIDVQGSISAAARDLGMSYRRAWLLVESMNHGFTTPVVTTSTGGGRGGGAVLTPWGRDVVHRYRALEDQARTAVRAHLAALNRRLARQ
jgi:molybdate transport system regulatory protein